MYVTGNPQPMRGEPVYSGFGGPVALRMAPMRHRREFIATVQQLLNTSDAVRSGVFRPLRIDGIWGPRTDEVFRFYTGLRTSGWADTRAGAPPPEPPSASGFGGRIRGLRGVPFSIPAGTILTLPEDVGVVFAGPGGGTRIAFGVPNPPARVAINYSASLTPVEGGYVLGGGTIHGKAVGRFNLSTYSYGTGRVVVPVRAGQAMLLQGSFVTAYAASPTMRVPGGPALSAVTRRAVMPPTPALMTSRLACGRYADLIRREARTSSGYMIVPRGTQAAGSGDRPTWVLDYGSRVAYSLREGAGPGTHSDPLPDIGLPIVVTANATAPGGVVPGPGIVAHLIPGLSDFHGRIGLQVGSSIRIFGSPRVRAISTLEHRMINAMARAQNVQFGRGGGGSELEQAIYRCAVAMGYRIPTV